MTWYGHDMDMSNTCLWHEHLWTSQRHKLPPDPAGWQRRFWEEPANLRKCHTQPPSFLGDLGGRYTRAAAALFGSWKNGQIASNWVKIQKLLQKKLDVLSFFDFLSFLFSILVGFFVFESNLTKSKNCKKKLELFRCFLSICFRVFFLFFRFIFLCVFSFLFDFVSNYFEPKKHFQFMFEIFLKHKNNV